MPRQATRWPDIVGAAAEGVAVIAGDGEYEFVSGQFAAMADLTVEAMIGRDAAELQVECQFPAGAHVDLSPTSTTRLDCRRIDASGRLRAHRVTMTPLRGGRVAVLAFDNTAMEELEAARRRTQRQLVVAEDDARHALCQRIHDGPIQLLTALRIRLEVAEDGDPERRRLRTLAEDTAAHLRTILVDLSLPLRESSPTELLSSWLAPLTDGSVCELTFVDETDGPIDREVTEALFVALYDMVDVVRAIGTPRRLGVRLAVESGGVEMVVTVPRPTEGYDSLKQLRSRSAREVLGTVGGTFLVERQPNQHRVVMRVPLDAPAEAAPPPTAPPAPVSEPGADPGPARGFGSPALGEADWQAIAQAAFQGLVELDDELRMTFANDAFAESIGRRADDLIGGSLRDAIRSENRPVIDRYLRQVVDGETLRFEWRRIRRSGAPAWMQVLAKPWMVEGRFTGATVLTLDTTELHTADLTREAALDDLDRVRAEREQDLLSRLLGDQRFELEALLNELDRVVDGRPQDAAMAAIGEALGESMAQIRDEASRLWRPSFGDGRDHLTELRETTAALLTSTGTELRLRDESSPPLRGEAQVALFQIAREAVINAATHGRADTVSVSFRSDRSSCEVSVVDDGAGAAPEELVSAPGHLGITSMEHHASRLGGTVRILPSDRGVTVIAHVPSGHSAVKPPGPTRHQVPRHG
ncbi:MAG: PAS domain-containing protein [Actinomycetota bacterium]